MKLFGFLRKKKNTVGEGEVGMNTEFVKSIIFEEDPFEEETPEDVRFYDLNGNEASL